MRKSGLVRRSVIVVVRLRGVLHAARRLMVPARSQVLRRVRGIEPRESVRMGGLVRVPRVLQRCLCRRVRLVLLAHVVVVVLRARGLATVGVRLRHWAGCTGV